MKKIVVATDALNYDADLVDYAINAAAYSWTKALTGLFIIDTANINIDPGIKMFAGQTYVEEIVMTDEEIAAMDKKVQQNMDAFSEACARKGVQATCVYRKGFPQDIILHTSRYADLLIIAPSLSFGGNEHTPSGLVREVMLGAECPVLLAPESYRPLNEVVIAFDGSRSSMMAAKQFAYQLPALCSDRVTVLRVRESDSDDEDADATEADLSSWMMMHCSNYTYVTLTGDPQDVLFGYFMESDDESKMLVAGAYGRSALSRFLKPGTTDLVVKASDIPVFIAHR